MDKAEIEKEVLQNYPVYIKKLRSIEDGLNNAIKWYLKNHPDLCKGGDFRPGTISRFLSSSISVRFHLDRTIEFISKKNWDKIFLNEYVPALIKPLGHLGHFKDIDLMSRFYLFHSFFHQLETTIRILYAELNLRKGKPIDMVNNYIQAYPIDLLQCVDALRNTIHNNGYYRPFDSQPQTIKYKTSHIDINFSKDQRTSVSTDQTIYLIRYLIEHTETLLKSPQVKALPLTKDRN